MSHAHLLSLVPYQSDSHFTRLGSESELPIDVRCMTFRFLTPFVIACALVTGCKTRQPAEYTPLYGAAPPVPDTIPRYSLGVPAIRHARSLWDRYAQLVTTLNKDALGFELKLESGQTPDAYDARLRKGAFDFAIVDSYQVLVAENLGYSVIARTEPQDRVRGIILVHRDAGIPDVAALRGRTIAFTNPTALAATLLNLYGLRETGLDVRRSANVRYTHSPETSLLNASLKRVDAAAVSIADWEIFQHDHAGDAAQLATLWQSDDLSGPAVMASNSVPRAHVHSLQSALTYLRAQTRGREALLRAGIAGFEAGNSVSYDDVWDFLQRYRRTIGPLPDRMVAR